MKKSRFFYKDLAVYRKWYKTGPQLLWNVNRNSHAFYRMVLYPMTLSDLEWLSEIFNDMKCQAERPLCGSRASCFLNTTSNSPWSQLSGSNTSLYFTTFRCHCVTCLLWTFIHVVSNQHYSIVFYPFLSSLFLTLLSHFNIGAYLF